MKSKRKNEEINDDDPYMVKIVTKEERFKLIKDDSFDKNLKNYSFDSLIKIRENRIKKFVLNCYKNNCKKDDLIITVVVILSIMSLGFGISIESFKALDTTLDISPYFFRSLSCFLTLILINFSLDSSNLFKL